MNENLKFVSDEKLAELAFHDYSADEIEQLFTVRDSIGMPGMMAAPELVVADFNSSDRLVGREMYVTGILHLVDSESEINVTSHARRLKYDGLSLDKFDASIMMRFCEVHGSVFQARFGEIAMWLATPAHEAASLHNDR